MPFVNKTCLTKLSSYFSDKISFLKLIFSALLDKKEAEKKEMSIYHHIENFCWNRITVSSLFKTCVLARIKLEIKPHQLGKF